MTRIIGIVNLKGGVGKTTTSVNLGAALALLGLKVLLVDLDPQKSLTGWSGIESRYTTGDILINNTEPAEVIVKWPKTNCWILPAGYNLRAVEDQLLTFDNREHILREKLKTLDEYDYIIIDSAPSYGLLTINTICASDEIIIPLQTEILALESTIPFFETLGEIKRKFHPNLKIAGILPNMFDTRTNLSKSILDQMKASEYLGPLMFKTCIRKNVRLAETPSLGCAITRYGSTYGAEDFKALAEEILTDDDRAIIASLKNDLLDSAKTTDNESDYRIQTADTEI
ncbi:MAG: ParA family protein [candidate division Zixibacteria bacterium]|nr:ParA family protein [candidate division Zixibacteria bacterium]